MVETPQFLLTMPDRLIHGKPFPKALYNGWILDGNYGLPINTGAKQLSLPFFNAGTAANPNTKQQPQQYEIVRRPPAGESALSTLGRGATL